MSAITSLPRDVVVDGKGCPVAVLKSIRLHPSRLFRFLVLLTKIALDHIEVAVHHDDSGSVPNTKKIKI